MIFLSALWKFGSVSKVSANVRKWKLKYVAISKPWIWIKMLNLFGNCIICIWYQEWALIHFIHFNEKPIKYKFMLNYKTKSLEYPDMAGYKAKNVYQNVYVCVCVSDMSNHTF